jgi:hypothetical protein
MWSCSSKPSALVEENVAGRNHLRAVHAVRPARATLQLLEANTTALILNELGAAR